MSSTFVRRPSVRRRPLTFYKKVFSVLNSRRTSFQLHILIARTILEGATKPEFWKKKFLLFFGKIWFFFFKTLKNNLMPKYSKVLTNNYFINCPNNYRGHLAPGIFKFRIFGQIWQFWPKNIKKLTKKPSSATVLKGMT